MLPPLASLSSDSSLIFPDSECFRSEHEGFVDRPCQGCQRLLCCESSSGNVKGHLAHRGLGESPCISLPQRLVWGEVDVELSLKGCVCLGSGTRKFPRSSVHPD